MLVINVIINHLNIVLDEKLPKRTKVFVKMRAVIKKIVISRRMSLHTDMRGRMCCIGRCIVVRLLTL